MSDRRLSVVVPARNEEALIGETLEAILASVARAAGVSRHDLWLPDTPFEVIVADDGSDDATAAIVGIFSGDVGVRLVRCAGGTCAAARNAGAAVSRGRVFCFVDADTVIPENAVDRILQLHEGEGRCLVLYRLVSREPGIRAWLWWTFWGLARHLPLARAKSMPAFMSCDRDALRDLRSLRREIRDRGGMAADGRGLLLSPGALPLRPQPQRPHVQPANGAPAVRIPSHLSRVDLRRALPLGPHFADRSHSTPDGRSLMPAARAYFFVCRVLGRLLRSGRYAKARIVDQDGQRQVRKYRLFYAPLLVRIGGPLMRLLDTGVRVLPQREWEEREQEVYRTLYGASIATDAGVLVLPCFRGETLAALLEDPTLEESARRDAIQRAVVALAEFHRRGFTHGDAMAENVLIDPESGVAHWFDFETVHDSSRSIAWRRADDVRALLVTCLVRTEPEKRAGILRLILDVYADDEVIRVLATSFASVFRRPLTFHLAQAGLSFQCFREIRSTLHPWS